MSAKTLRPGSVLMESILVFPLLLLLISMILQYAHIWTARQITAYAAYCATRAIMTVPAKEKQDAANYAARLACSWMALASLPGSSPRSGGSSKKVHVGKLSGDMSGGAEISGDEVINLDDGSPQSDEVLIPGWGTIPGSNSVKARVKTEIKSNGEDSINRYAMVTVTFKFPLLMPLAGRMISWFAHKSRTDAEEFDYGHHKLTGGNARGWVGEETVMDREGNLVDRGRGSTTTWGAEGKYPAIELTETCILPMPYSTANFPEDGYSKNLLMGGGS